MGDLAAAFAALRSVVAAAGYEFGVHQSAPGATEAAAQELGVPSDFVTAYVSAGPAPNTSIPWVVEEMHIFSIPDLFEAQDGYRWSGPERRRLDGWPSEWVVVAAVFGDPYLIDTSQDGLPVYFARHGAGEWRRHRIAPNMPTFIEALAIFESVLLNEFNSEVWDQDGLRADFTRRLTEVLAAKLESTDLANFMRALAE